MKFSVFILFSVVILNCSQTDEKPVEKTIQEADNNITDNLVQEMIDKYDAERYWFKSSHNFFYTYSIEMQEMVLGDSSKPILIYVNITDVMKTETGYKAIFSNFFDIPISDLYYELILSKEQIDYLLSPRESIFSEFAIVANINQVVRANSQTRIEEGFGDDPSTTFIDVPGAFILKGTCLDILFIGEATYRVEYLSDEELEEGLD